MEVMAFITDETDQFNRPKAYINKKKFTWELVALQREDSMSVMRKDIPEPQTFSTCVFQLMGTEKNVSSKNLKIQTGS